MAQWYSEITEILEQEPETWLAYLYGVQFHNIPHLGRLKPRFRGVVPRLLVVVHFMMRNLGLRRMPRLSSETRPRFLLYAGTLNQMSALDATIDSFRSRGESVIAIARKEFVNTAERRARYQAYCFGMTDEVKAVLLMIIRGRRLYKMLKTKRGVEVDWYLNRFCQVYVYLAYFYELLRGLRPEFVVIANDHNVPNRCILAVAHRLGLKTVYLQHASVSDRFPALRVNYAFLDGQAALDIYRRCEKNQPRTGRTVPTPHVFLTGQKKRLVRVRSDGEERNHLGIALNALDDPEAVIGFVQRITDAGERVCCRWHPGQPAEQIRVYRDAWVANPFVQLSDPRRERISDFLGKIRVLIAGNSSIHLEAVLVGVRSFYYEFTPPDRSDVYGYVEHGLTPQIHSVDELLESLRTEGAVQYPDEDVVRHYSATYHTVWDGREGELVSLCLRELAAGVDPKHLFGTVAFNSHPHQC